MDWKYILSMAPNASALDDSKKDELLNTLAWHDFTEEKLDSKRHTALLALCQEIMKYKSEQVDALLAELDEIAVKQAEEEVKTRDSDERSKKSEDSDEHELKYRDLKSKYRKLQKQLEAIVEDNERHKQSIKMLEQERVYLQKELRGAQRQDDSASDISETVKDQQRNLMESVQQKNTQISQLLTDIENVESDNLQMRTQLAAVRDELADATEKLTTLNDDYKSLQLRQTEIIDQCDHLRLENEGMRTQIADLIDDKDVREKEFEQFAKEIDARIEDWKHVLATKNKEIEQLRSKTGQETVKRTATSSSSSSQRFPVEDTTQLQVLRQAVSEREESIIHLQKQLEMATKDMVKTTKILKQVSTERDSSNKKCDKLNGLIKELKKQLKSAHSRCQDLNAEVEYQEKLVQSKHADMDKLITDIPDLSVKKLLKELEVIKSEKRSKEKKVMELVRSCNNLRNAAENYEKENTSLRERLGLSEDDFVSTQSASIQQKRHKKQLEALRTKLDVCEEEKLQFRLEVQKLSKAVSNLSDQLLDAGETPIVDGQFIDTSKLRQRDTDEIDANATKHEYDALLEENDALRKGLHEILESVQNRQVATLKEIKSATLESLLRALDAKHVSGWYHPAMRLQAELHTLQGSNSTLREQLRLAREEMESFKEKTANMPIIEASFDSSNAEAIANLNNHLVNVLKNYHVDDETNTKLVEKLANNKREFLLVQEQVGILYKQYTDEKTKWESDLESAEQKLNDLSGEKQLLQQQLDAIALFTNPQNDDERKAKCAAEMTVRISVLTRQLVYLENQDMKSRSELKQCKQKLIDETQELTSRLCALKEANMKLNLQIDKLNQNMLTQSFVLPEDAVKLQNEYDNLLMKHRDLQKSIDDMSQISRNELDLLHEKIKLLETDNDELANMITSKLPSSSTNLDELRQQLAKAEINEATEKQRANHINSLYELVKEQLAKSEARHNEFQTYSAEIMTKNLMLQESVKKLEDVILHYVDSALYSALEKERDALMEKNHIYAADVSRMQEELDAMRKDIATRSLWGNIEQYEVHSLKHLIVDLQAAGDDKVVITRLSSDVVMARTTEAEVRNRLDAMGMEMSALKEEFARKSESFIKEIDRGRECVEAMKKKNRNLEIIIKQQRHHYLGYVPYTTQEKLVQKIQEIAVEKDKIHRLYERNAQLEHETALIKETFETKTDVLNELNQIIRDGDEQAKALEKWFLDKTNIQLQELRCRRQAEFKETQLQRALARVEEQAQQIARLEGELLQSLYLTDRDRIGVMTKAEKEIRLEATPANVVEIVEEIMEKLHVETQTDPTPSPPPSSTVEEDNECTATTILEVELQKMRVKLLDCEMIISMLRQQMGDKQSQITFYEKHILDIQAQLQQKKEALGNGGDARPEESVPVVQDDKERIIFELQSLLKKDRDEHSAAAVRFQDELRQLQMQLKQTIESTSEKPAARAAVEYYIQQVHALEKLTADLETSVSTLGTQLAASREEAVRWRTLANDRLQSVEDVRIQLEEQHGNELESYKAECEKWRNEVNTLQAYINAYKKDILDLRPSIEKELKEKDNRIHELLVTMRQLKSEVRRKPIPSDPVTQHENLEEVKESLLREQDVLRKRCEQLMNRERNAREEIRTLKGQLLKRPALSARSSDALAGGGKEQQQAKRIAALEAEVAELRVQLERATAAVEAHQTKVHADFDKWNKQKQWQQAAERAKLRLKERTDECEKLQRTCASYRMLIERLERDKNNMEVRLKAFKSGAMMTMIGGGGDAPGNAMINAEAEISELRAKLEQQQHHSGALSAALLQDKLEAQERKIAVLEMSAKGSGELRSEVERLQTANSTLQKSNLRLEAENLDLRLDLEKSSSELPHLREQINYLENYIEVLKSEQSSEEREPKEDGENPTAAAATESRRVNELERAVIALKRVVEKLQVENKRLAGGTRPCQPDRGGSADRLRRECARLKEQFGDKITALEKELKVANEKLEKSRAVGRRATSNDDVQMNANARLQEELLNVTEELQHKTELLDKVKGLLQRAAVKEKALLDQISSLKAMVENK